MANPQLEDGYTRIANDLLEALVRIPLRDLDRRVFLAVLRLTYGFGKKEDRLAYSQVANLTGLPRRSVIRSMAALSEGCLLVSDPSLGGDRYDTRKPRKWSIQKDFDHWKTPKTYSWGSDRSDTFASDRSVTLQRKERKNLKTKTSTGDSRRRASLPLEAWACAYGLAAVVASVNAENRYLRNGSRGKTITQWAKDLDLLHRKDERPWEKIQWLIDWLDRGETENSLFWRGTVQSAGNLRTNWDQMAAKINLERQQRKERRPHGTSSARAGGRVTDYDGLFQGP